jgi:hypothetical protein
MGGAIIDNAFKLPCMVTRILRRTPDTGDTKFAATALRIVVGAIHLAPGMAAPDLDAPTIGFRMPNRLFNFLLRMPGTGHVLTADQDIDRNAGCQMTTYIGPSRLVESCDFMFTRAYHHVSYSFILVGIWTSAYLRNTRWSISVNGTRVPVREWHAQHRRLRDADELSVGARTTGKPVAGSNGAGTSTFYDLYLRALGVPFVNADLIARALHPETPERFSYDGAAIRE